MVKEVSPRLRELSHLTICEGVVTCDNVIYFDCFSCECVGFGDDYDDYDLTGLIDIRSNAESAKSRCELRKWRKSSSPALIPTVLPGYNLNVRPSPGAPGLTRASGVSPPTRRRRRPCSAAGLAALSLVPALGKPNSMTAELYLDSLVDVTINVFASCIEIVNLVNLMK